MTQHKPLSTAEDRLGENSLGESIEDFVYERIESGKPRFYIHELLDYLSSRIAINPTVPKCVLPILRRCGVITYYTVDRRTSYYELTGATKRGQIASVILWAMLYGEIPD
jgi:hypothetical protein